MQEIKSFRKANEKHFLRKDGSIVAQVYDDAIHFERNGIYEEIDNSLKKGGNYYVNKQNSYQVYLKEESKGDFIKWNVLQHHIDIELRNQNVVPLQILESTSSFYQTVTYPNILKGIDLIYQLTPTKLKESFVIKKKEDIQDITFQLQTKLDLLLKEDGKIGVHQNKNEIFLFDAPYIIDNKGVKSSNIYYQLLKNNQGYTLTLKINKEEIEKLSYPITIDPTITSSTKENNVYDTYIFEGDTNIDRNNTDILKAGVEKINGVNRINRTLLKFELPTIGTGSQIINARLSLIGYGEMRADFPTSLVTIHEITEPWEESKATWNQMTINIKKLSSKSTE